jgi:hypothetical protein
VFERLRDFKVATAPLDEGCLLAAGVKSVPSRAAFREVLEGESFSGVAVGASMVTISQCVFQPEEFAEG